MLMMSAGSSNSIPAEVTIDNVVYGVESVYSNNLAPTSASAASSKLKIIWYHHY